MQNRSVINSPGVTELIHKRHQAIKRKMIFYIILFLFLILGISLSSRINKLNINEIKISGNVVVDSSSIESVVKDNLHGHYLWIIPKTNFLVYPQEKITRELTSKYPRLKKVTLNNKNIRTIEVIVQEYEGKYLWCGDVTIQLSSLSEEKCYFMDSDGYIFDEAPFFSGEVYFKFYGQTNKQNDSVLGSFYNPLIFSKLIQFKESIENMELKPVYVWINNQNEIYLSLSNLGIRETNPSIILNTNSDYQKIAENLQAAVTTEPLKTNLKNDYAKLLYIDLKFGNKVYYKFQ
jgi:cell division septal protein FtsQ